MSQNYHRHPHTPCENISTPYTKKEWVTKAEACQLLILLSPLRYGRDSNPRPPAWQAGILTSWTTTPFWDLCRSSIIMIFRPVLFRLPCGSCLNLCFNVLVASSVISFLHCKGKSFFWTVQISVDILTNFYTIIFCKIAVTRVCRGYKHPIYLLYINPLFWHYAYWCRDMPWHVRFQQQSQMQSLMGGHAVACPYTLQFILHNPPKIDQ